MLDTDTVSYALRGVGNVGQRILATKRTEICISSLTLAEFRSGPNGDGHDGCTP
jgi:predicted nucleic acid-binding protein